MSPLRTAGLPVAALAAAGIAGIGYAIAETHLFTLRTAELAILPPGSSPKRILHLSDLHMTPNQRDKQRWVADLDRLEPDLVVGTGDFLADRHAINPVLDALAPLLERPGVFTLGSNDYLAPRPFNPARYFLGPSRLDAGRSILPWQDLVAGLTRRGWVDLDNRAVRLALTGWTIDSRGVNDPHIELDRYDMVAGPFDPSATLRLGVTHAPYRRVLEPMAGDGASLILAGHTHGGQLRVPGYGALVTNCDIDRARARGVSSYTGFGSMGEHTAAMNVSAGLGCSPYAPIRFACRPEASLLLLRAVDEPSGH